MDRASTITRSTGARPPARAPACPGRAARSAPRAPAVEQVVDRGHPREAAPQRGGRARRCTRSTPARRASPGKVLLLAAHPFHAPARVHRDHHLLADLGPGPAALARRSRFTNEVSPDAVPRRQLEHQLARVGLHASLLAGGEEDQVQADVDHAPRPAWTYTCSSSPATASQVGSTGGGGGGTGRARHPLRERAFVIDQVDPSRVPAPELAVRGQWARHDGGRLGQRLEHGQALTLGRAQVDQSGRGAKHRPDGGLVAQLPEPHAAGAVHRGREGLPVAVRALEAADHHGRRPARGRPARARWRAGACAR